MRSNSHLTSEEHHFWRAIMVSLICLVCGCNSGDQSVKAGTHGTLRFGNKVTSEIVVTVHRQNGASLETAGFGTTAEDGSFSLYTPGAKGPLWLEPGQYRFTLESIGPPVNFPKEYSSPDSTPLKMEWTNDSKTVDLEAPQNLIGS